MTSPRLLLGSVCALLLGAGSGVATAALLPTADDRPGSTAEVVRVAGTSTPPATPRARPGGPATDLRLDPDTPFAADAQGNLLLPRPPRTGFDQGQLLRIDRNRRVWTTPMRYSNQHAEELIALPGAVLYLAGGSLYRLDRADGSRHLLLSHRTLHTTDIAVSTDEVYLLAGTDHRAYTVARDALGAGRLSRSDLRPYAGTGTAGFAGDGGEATAARLDEPTAIAATPEGTGYIADTGNGRIREIDRNGEIDTIAGGSPDPRCNTDDAAGSYVGPIQQLVARPDGSLVFTERPSQERLNVPTAPARLRELRPNGRLTEIEVGFATGGQLTSGPRGEVYAAKVTGELYRLAPTLHGEHREGDCHPLVADGEVTKVAEVHEKPASLLAALASGDIAYVSGRHQPTLFGARRATVRLLSTGRAVFRTPGDARLLGIAPAGDDVLVWCDTSGRDATDTVLFRVRRDGKATALITDNATVAAREGLPLRGGGITAAAFDPASERVVVASGDQLLELVGGELRELPWRGWFGRLVPDPEGHWIAHGRDGVVRLRPDGSVQPVLPARSNPPAPPSEVVPTLTGAPDQQPDVQVTGYAVADDGTLFAAPRWDLSGFLLRVATEGGSVLIAGDGTAGPLRRSRNPTASIGRANDVAVQGDQVFLATGAGIVRVTAPGVTGPRR